MEQMHVNATVPPYEEWPSVPKGPLPERSKRDQSQATEMEMSSSADGQSRRATSVLSMEDIEAAQALEGLRTGNSNPSEVLDLH